MSGEPRLTRRAVLLGTLAVPLAACRQRSSPRPTGATTADSDRAALLDALGTEQRLVDLGQYALSSADPDVVAHLVHLARLRQLLRIGTASPQASPSVPARPIKRAGFDAAVAATVPHLQSLAVTVEGGTAAAVLASIAASHASPPPVIFQGQWYGAPS